MAVTAAAAVAVPSPSGSAAHIRTIRQDNPRSTIFAPPPPDYLDIMPPPPPDETIPDSQRPPLPPVAPPPAPPPRPPPVPAQTHSEWDLLPGRETNQESTLLDEVREQAADYVPAPTPFPALAPAPRGFKPFAVYGPPDRSLAQDDPLQEGLETSSDWGAPGALAANLRQGLIPSRKERIRGSLQEGLETSSDWGSPGRAIAGNLRQGSRVNPIHAGSRTEQEVALQEGMETSSDWGEPGALASHLRRGSISSRGSPIQRGSRTQQEEALREGLETSSDWGEPGGVARSLNRGGSLRPRLAAQTSAQLSAQAQPTTLQQDEPNQEFSEISSDWGAPGSSQQPLGRKEQTPPSPPPPPPAPEMELAARQQQDLLLAQKRQLAFHHQQQALRPAQQQLQRRLEEAHQPIQIQQQSQSQVHQLRQLQEVQPLNQVQQVQQVQRALSQPPLPAQPIQQSDQPPIEGRFVYRSVSTQQVSLSCSKGQSSMQRMRRRRNVSSCISRIAP